MFLLCVSVFKKNDLHISWTDWMWFMVKRFSWPLFNRSKAVFWFDRVSITSQCWFLAEKENSFHSSGYQGQPHCEARWPSLFGQSILERALLFHPPTSISGGKALFFLMQNLWIRWNSAARSMRKRLPAFFHHIQSFQSLLGRFVVISQEAHNLSVERSANLSGGAQV